MLLFMQELNPVVYFDKFPQMIYNAVFQMDSKTGSHHQAMKKTLMMNYMAMLLARPQT